MTDSIGVEYCGVKPFQAHLGDAGADLRVNSILDYNGDYNTLKVNTGTYVAIPDGCVGFVFARSSLHKKGWGLANGVGVIDSGYRGEISVVLTTLGIEADELAIGERIAQLVIVPFVTPRYYEVDEFSTTTDRGDGGFGSTGE